MIIINADDWGRSRVETDTALRLFAAGRITAVSGMVFMEDSARAAGLARESGIDVGLHLNLNEPFNGNDVPPQIRSGHETIVRFLRRGRYAQLVYHPGLRQSFRRVYAAQAAEFERLYGRSPSHVDGHQHMHLCSNVLLDGIVPKGQRVRRSFSFSPGEKSALNRAYRRFVDWRLSRRYRLTDYFFALSQNLEPSRLQRVADLSLARNVELMTHPVDAREQALLTSPDFGQILKPLRTAAYRDL
jgi:predicted glycoside hydrolase/deacetylase ChbG (UPF0249 family)